MHFDSGIVLGAINPLEEVVAHELFRFELWGMEIVVSNHMLMMGLAGLILIIFLPLAVRDDRLVRRGFGNFIETICVFLREEVARPFLGDSTDKHIGFIWTIFFFILTMNLLGLVPIGKAITLMTGKVNHLEGAATANIWIVGALAMVAFLAIHVSGMREQGMWNYFKNFAPKVPKPMIPFIYFMEIIGAIVKPFSLAIRLFANMFAGHMLIATLFVFIWIFKNYLAAVGSVLVAIPASLLEILVAVLQAYIFTFLTTVFMGFAVRPEH
jgi:F-type H+-transporting ATPase subunit a